MKKILLLLSATMVMISSCQKENVLNKDETGNLGIEPLMALREGKEEKHLNAKLELAGALVKTMQENVSLRKLIKEKALEMFNNDYEVLFEMIKDEQIGGTTLKEAIVRNMANPELLDVLEREVPTLTILVPILPENSFSAKIWNIENTPAVAVQRNTSNEVPIVYNDNKHGVIKPGTIPGFPVLVIKNNERVVSNKQKGYENLKTRELTSKSGNKFKFIGEEFDGKLHPIEDPIEKNRRAESTNRGDNSTIQRIVQASSADQKMKDAFDIYENADGWQRDYIYYDLTPSNVNGPFKYDYQEHVMSFRMMGDPMTAIQKLSDQTGEPIPYLATVNSGPYWTEGAFEFKVKSLINAKNGIGEEKIGFISAQPSDIFHITYVSQAGPIWIVDYISHTTKQTSLPIFNWNLDEYASTIAIAIEEVDEVETNTITDTRTVKFASNFQIDVPTSQKIKVGLKFGASNETTTSQSVQRVRTLGNDELGEVIINFADKFFIEKKSGILTGWRYETREYQSGWFSISVEPKKVQ